MTSLSQDNKVHFSKESGVLLTWSLSLVKHFVSKTNRLHLNNFHYFYAEAHIEKDAIKFNICSNADDLKCTVSMYIGKETLLLSNTLIKRTRTVYSPRQYYYDLVQLSSQDECYKKLKQHPSDTLIFICKLQHFERDKTTCVELPCTYDSLLKNSSFPHLKMIKTALEHSLESHLNDQVILRVGEEDVNVNKALLCAQSPVFAKMFQNDMKELKENIVHINDIKVDVLKALVSFLYSGKLQNSNFDFLCELYYASDKYLIDGLLHLCVDLLLPQISMKNAIQLLKLAFFHNDVRLKSCVLSFIEAKIETFISTEDWINLVDKEPKLALEVLKTLDL